MDPNDTPIQAPPTPGPVPPNPSDPDPTHPVPATKPAPRYVLSPPSGAHDWWEINDMQKQYAVVTVQKDFPCAEAIAKAAFKGVEGK